MNTAMHQPAEEPAEGQCRSFTDLPEPLTTLILLDVLEQQNLRQSCHALTVSRAFNARMKQALQQLPHLSFSHTCHSWATDMCMGFVARHCQKLRELHLSFCCQVTAAGLKTLAEGTTGKTLQRLHVENCGHVGDGSSLRGLCVLRDLELTWAYSITSAGIRPLARQLERLSLHGCELVDDGLCQDLQRVQYLNLAYTRVTNEGLTQLAAGSPAMRRLTLAHQQYNIFTSTCTTEAGQLRFCALRPEVKLVHTS